ncbi:MAG: EthD family reductase [Nocardioidaceae bacterium]
MATTARFFVLWGRPGDPAAFEQHYRDVHIPLALEIPGLRRYTLSRDIAPVHGKNACYVVAEIDFDDLGSLQAAFQSPQGRATAADAALLAEQASVQMMIYELEMVLS